jgi:hypothetical protein
LLNNRGNPGKITAKSGHWRAAVITTGTSGRFAMLIPCSRAQAIFAGQGVRLERLAPGSMVWDEHGGIYILRVEELAVTEVQPTGGETGMRLEIPLSSREGLGRDLEEFAAAQTLPLAPPASLELTETAVLAACHLPGQNLFIFAEDPELSAIGGGDTLIITIAGTFKARRVPCQATDLVIHLNKAAMARLTALVLSLARAGL